MKKILPFLALASVLGCSTIQVPAQGIGPETAWFQILKKSTNYADFLTQLNTNAPSFTIVTNGGNAALNQISAPVFLAGSLVFSNAPTGNIAVTNVDSGTGASAVAFYRGDGHWAIPAGTGGTGTNVFPAGIFVFGVSGANINTLWVTNTATFLGLPIALTTSPSGGITIVSPNGLCSGTLTWGNDNALHSVAN